MKHRAFDFRTAFIDLLLNFMVSLVFIFMLASILINPVMKKQEEGIKKNAQMIVEVTWDPSMDCDVDIWARDPANNVVFFNQRDKGIMHIERDDLGFANDILSMAKEFVTGKKIENKDNEEVWVLRGIVQGEFTFNVHLYSCRVGAKPLSLNAPITLPVHVKVIKINPDYITVHEDTVTFQRVWQEITVLNFTLDEFGNVISTNKSPKNLVKVKEQ